MALNRSRFSWIVVAVVAFAVGLTAAWFSGAGLVRDNIDGWARDWRAQGNFVSLGEIKVEGFPLLFRTRLAEPVLGRHDGKSPWQWRPSGLVLTVKPWDAMHMVARLEGLHRIRYTGRYGQRSIALTVTSARARFGANVNGASDLDFDAKGLTATPETAGTRDANNTIRIDHVTLVGSHEPLGGADHRTPTANVTLIIGGITLPSAGARNQPHMALGRRIENLTLEATVLGALSTRFGIEDFVQWRDNGGTIDIQKFVLHWGPLNFTATGTLALDQDLQPMAAMTATITGFIETLDALAAARVVKARDAKMAKMLLSMLAKRPEQGGPARLTVALTVQNGKLFVGPVALMKVPRLKWF